MAIISYLAHPHEGQKEALFKALTQVNQCDVIPAENKDVLVVVTDTLDKNADEKVKEQIETISSLKLLVMVSGFNTPKN